MRLNLKPLSDPSDQQRKDFLRANNKKPTRRLVFTFNLLMITSQLQQKLAV